MAFQPTPQDVSVIITSSSVSRSADSEPRFLTERRITPTWTVEQVKSKLETMTGVPPGSQRLRVKVPGRPDQWADNDAQLIGDYGIMKGSEIEVGLIFLFCFFFRFVSLSVLDWFLENCCYLGAGHKCDSAFDKQRSCFWDFVAELATLRRVAPSLQKTHISHTIKLKLYFSIIYHELR